MFFPLLKLLNPNSHYRIFRVDVSDENNPLWSSVKIGTVPTLVAFEGGVEFWRRNGVIMVGLRRKDFEIANAMMNAAQ